MINEISRQNITLWSAPGNIKFSTKVFSKKEIELIFTTLRSSKDYPKNDFGEFQKLRDYCCLQFIYWCALRPNEGCKIRFKDIDKENEMLFVSGTSNKVHKDRIIPLPRQLLPVLKEYLSKPERFWKGSEYLFPSASNEALSASTLKAVFREKCLKPAGLYEPARANCPKDCRTRLYSLRKTRATQLLQETKDLYLVMNYLGHSDIRVTASYYVHANQEYLNYMKRMVNGEPLNEIKNSNDQLQQIQEMLKKLIEKTGVER